MTARAAAQTCKKHRHGTSRGYLISVVALILVQGCVPAPYAQMALTPELHPGPSFESFGSIPPDKAVVYFYRPARIFGDNAFTLMACVGDNDLILLKNGDYFPYVTEPGFLNIASHFVYGEFPTIVDPSIQKETTYTGQPRYHGEDTIALEPGHAYFVKFDFGYVAWNRMAPGLVDKIEAENDLKKCRLPAPEIAQPIKQTRIVKRIDSGMPFDAYVEIVRDSFPEVQGDVFVLRHPKGVPISINAMLDLPQANQVGGPLGFGLQAVTPEHTIIGIARHGEELRLFEIERVATMGAPWSDLGFGGPIPSTDILVRDTRCPSRTKWW